MSSVPAGPHRARRIVAAAASLAVAVSCGDDSTGRRSSSPRGYAPDPVALPHMGVHWTDPASPEFNGQPFTRRFIYGLWDGKPTFMEPMVTTAFLETQPTDTVAVPMASRHEPLGFYPDRYISIQSARANSGRA